MISNVIPYDYARVNRVIGFTEDSMHYAYAESKLPELIYRELLFHFQDQFSLQILSDADFNMKLTSVYSFNHSNTMIEDSDIDEDYDLQSAISAISPSQDLLNGANEAPIARLINAVISEAIKKRASDIHFEPYQDQLRVRFRIDGHLIKIFTQDIRLANSIISRIKIISGLDIAERRKPQDGRISLTLGAKKIDVRVSSLPSAYGERLVLRILDKASAQISLDEIGFSSTVLEEYKKLLEMREGIVLVTGPTGSGKTTTLYAGLQYIKSKEQNILTVEDPIEYTIDGIGQTQVNNKTGYTFATGLRAILRQDPDIVMVGEIRDEETASIAIQASLTGHLVLSTVHTNSAVGAITRLKDIGAESYLLASSVRGILSQRLLRKLCNICKEQVELTVTSALFNSMSNDIKIYKPVGCSSCNHTGYYGRVPATELFLIDGKAKSLIHENATEVNMQNELKRKDFLLATSALSLLKGGVTSEQEVLALLSS